MDKGKKGVFGDGKSGYNTKKKKGGGYLEEKLLLTQVSDTMICRYI